MKNKNNNAFTLIELLVVIAIIALLLSIVTPALNKVKETAQTLICATNLKSYGAALQAYGVENKDKAPFMVSWLYSQKTIQAGVDSGAIPARCRWHEDSDEPDGSLWPYLSTGDVHMCPVFRKYALQLGIDECPNSAQHSRNTRFSPNYSYSMNYFIGFDWKTYIEFQPPAMAYDTMKAREISMKLSNVKSPGKCFAFSEENLWAVGPTEWDSGRGTKFFSKNVLNDNALWVWAGKDNPDNATDNVATYHKTSKSKRNDGEANLVFVDGHVETRRGNPGREAYENYGRPYPGHDNVNIW